MPFTGGLSRILLIPEEKAFTEQLQQRFRAVDRVGLVVVLRILHTDTVHD